MSTSTPSPARGELRRFDVPNFLLYFGAVVAAAATGGVIGTAFEEQGASVMLVAALSYLALYALVSYLLIRKRSPTPGGLFAAMAVALVPLAVYAVEKLADLWPRTYPGRFVVFHEQIHGGWIAMELITVLVGLAAIHLVRFPFIAAPVGFILWYFGMDLAAGLFGADFTTDQLAGTLLVVGWIMVAASLALDGLGHRGYAFWGHVFGFLAVTGGVELLAFDHSDDLIWGLVGGVGLLVLLAAVPLWRATFAVFGAIGLLASLVFFVNEAFEDSWAFPFLITFAGVAFLAFAMLVQARGRRWRETLMARVRPARRS